MQGAAQRKRFRDFFEAAGAAYRKGYYDVAEHLVDAYHAGVDLDDAKNAPGNPTRDADADDLASRVQRVRDEIEAMHEEAIRVRDQHARRVTDLGEYLTEAEREVALTREWALAALRRCADLEEIVDVARSSLSVAASGLRMPLLSRGDAEEKANFLDAQARALAGR